MKFLMLPLVISIALLSPPGMAQAPTEKADSQTRAAQAASAAEAASAARAAAAVRAHPALEPAMQRELEQARRELERASGRLAELTQQLAREDIEVALRRPAFSRPAIGIVMAADDLPGVRLAGVTPGSPAAKAALRSGDRLLRVDGKAIDAAGATSQDRLDRARELLDDLRDGEEVRLAYSRAGKNHEVTLIAEPLPALAWWRQAGPDATLLRMPVDPQIALNFPVDVGTITPFAGCSGDNDDCLIAPLAEAYRWRGLRLAALEPRLGRYFGTDRGVLVLTAPPDVLGKLEPGDVILAIDATAVAEMQDAMRLMRGKQPGDNIDFDLLRDRKKVHVQIAAPKLARFPMVPAPPAPPAAPAPPAPPRTPPPPPVRPAEPPAPPALSAPPPAPLPPLGPKLVPAPRPAAAPAPPSAPAAPAPPAPPPPPPEGDGVLWQILER